MEPSKPHDFLQHVSVIKDKSSISNCLFIHPVDFKQLVTGYDPLELLQFNSHFVQSSARRSKKKSKKKHRLPVEIGDRIYVVCPKKNLRKSTLVGCNLAQLEHLEAHRRCAFRGYRHPSLEQPLQSMYVTLTQNQYRERVELYIRNSLVGHVLSSRQSILVPATKDASTSTSSTSSGRFCIVGVRVRQGMFSLHEPRFERGYVTPQTRVHFVLMDDTLEAVRRARSEGRWDHIRVQLQDGSWVPLRPLQIEKFKSRKHTWFVVVEDHYYYVDNNSIRLKIAVVAVEASTKPTSAKPLACAAATSAAPTVTSSSSSAHVPCKGTSKSTSPDIAIATAVTNTNTDTIITTTTNNKTALAVTNNKNAAATAVTATAAAAAITTTTTTTKITAATATPNPPPPIDLDKQLEGAAPAPAANQNRFVKLSPPKTLLWNLNQPNWCVYECEVTQHTHSASLTCNSKHIL